MKPAESNTSPVAAVAAAIPERLKLRWQIAGWALKRFDVDATELMRRINWDTVPMPPWAYLTKACNDLYHEVRNVREGHEMKRAIQTIAQDPRLQALKAKKPQTFAWLDKAREEHRRDKALLDITEGLEWFEIRKRMRARTRKIQAIKKRLGIK